MRDETRSTGESKLSTSSILRSGFRIAAPQDNILVCAPILRLRRLCYVQIKTCKCKQKVKAKILLKYALNMLIFQYV